MGIIKCIAKCLRLNEKTKTNIWNINKSDKWIESVSIRLAAHLFKG